IPPATPADGAPADTSKPKALGGGVVDEGGVGGGGEKFAKVALAEAADFVAEGGGAFELEFFGGFAHLRFELFDDAAKIVLGADDVGLEVVGGNGQVVGFNDGGKFHVDSFVDGVGRDVVLDVVGLLLGAAA